MPAAKLLINFTKAAIEAIPAAAPEKRDYYNDTKVKGLQLLVTDTGAKSYYLYIRNAGKPVRHKLGRHPGMTPENARRMAEAARGRAATGTDLREERRAVMRDKVTLDEAFKAFKLARTGLRPRTLYDYGRFVDVAFKEWKDRPLVDRTKEQVAKLHQKLTAERGPAYADGAMRFLRALINFAQFHYEAPDGSPLLPDNPVRRLSQTRAWNGSKRRKTYIKPDQLAPWFKAVLSLKADPDDHEALTVSDWLQLMMLTGFRRNEALTLQWQYVDMPNRTMTVRDTKNGEDHTLPMSDYVHDLLDERRKLTGDKEYVFASYGKHGHMVDPRKPLDHVIKACGIPFTPHDLRRTFITVAESLDVPMYALKRLLNHKMSGDITPTYIITDVERLRIPMEKVTQHILERAGLSTVRRKRKERAA